jgi:diguanylate cyclase (GGDEF)-like protein
MMKLNIDLPGKQKLLNLKRLVYLVTQDEKFAEFINHQLSHFGYIVQTVHNQKELEKVIAEHISIAILLDISSLRNGINDELWESLRQSVRGDTPLFFIADINTQDVRLEAVRAGSAAFFTKPVDIIGLVDKLDKQEVKESENPYRVLIVEDQTTVAQYYQMVLRMAGMNAQVISDPTLVLAYLDEFHPDLILMDLYMPVVSGAELATIIRQMDEYVSIPIVFLSGEDDFAKHIEMMSLGSDDFLTKPIKASHLVAVVKSRLERLKILRSYMMRDSLTGLLNHSSFLGILGQEVNRCERQKNQLALAMIDVDNFKRVNDTYGHATGDIVLKGLSRLLKQRLRKSDIIGRYGGEEFAALFLDATAEQAYKVVDELRMHFSQMEFFPTPQKQLTVTFSAGIATYPEFTSAKQLSDAADAALYLAKEAGRNQVIVAAANNH